MRSDSAARCGASDAEYSSIRRLIVQAASAATSAEPPSPSTSMAASCDAPANTMVENPIAARSPRPFSAGVAPATSPNGTTPTSIGATAATPARSSARRGVPRTSGHHAGTAPARTHAYFRNFDVVLSASTLPAVWHVAQ